ncbi:hypothetical protein A3Q56_03237 [Intoshia linei]|uniref:Uncharacterized protein n=1 Tax=Intoshia linei TaxID=1819745 RepID=A0A177B4F9_9BILA|nr:hypothetical protein A3Q56_03237 [Intoshia linei]
MITYFSTQGIVGIVLSLLLVLCILIAIIFMKRNNDNGKYSPAKYENRGLPSYAMIVVPPEQRLI